MKAICTKADLLYRIDVNQFLVYCSAQSYAKRLSFLDLHFFLDSRRMSGSTASFIVYTSCTYYKEKGTSDSDSW